MIPALNLLAPDQKTEVARTKILLLIHESLLFLFIVLTLASVLLFGARILLEQKFRELVLEPIPGTAKIAKINSNIRALNQELVRINLAVSSFAYWTPVLTELVDKTPDGMQWKTLNMKSDGKMILTGTASFRNALVDFRDRLGESKNIRSVLLPLRYLVEEGESDFVMEIEWESADLQITPDGI